MAARKRSRARWNVTADVERFDEAIAFFRKRVSMTKEQVLALEAALREQAFWIGGGFQLDQIQRVFDRITTAIETGESFASWRDEVIESFESPAHAEVVFRNATQKAYNAGRVQQMREPDVVAVRPYLMYDAILDSRTTDICSDLDKTILPVDDPFWNDHTPPLHHNCRASLRSLRRADAERRGVGQRSDRQPQPGFGAAPQVDEEPWRPSRDQYDAELFRELEQKETSR